MPFGSDPSSRLVSRLVYENIIQRAYAKAFGVEDTTGSRRIDMVYADEPLSEAIMRRLEDADIVVADVSDNSPNVLFELGFRKATGKPCLCVSRCPGSSAFWAARYAIIDYSESGVERVADQLRKAFDSVRTRRRTDDTVGALLRRVREPDVFGTEMQDRAAAWRVSCLTEQLNEIGMRNWSCLVRPPANYADFMIQGVFELTPDNGQVLALTTPEFWRTQLGGGSGLLKQNARAASERGVRFKRVFILRDEDGVQERSDNIELLETHRAAQEYVSKTTGATLLEIRCCLPTLARARENLYQPFAILYDEERECCIVVRPTLGPGGEIEQIQFRFSPGQGADDRGIRELEALHDNAYNAGVGIDDALEVLGRTGDNGAQAPQSAD